MQTDHIEIVKYSDTYRQQLLDVWERSVLATHYFLAATDFKEIKESVSKMDFYALQIFCLVSKNRLLGFIGVADKKVEVLFLDPECIGQGLGWKLLNFGVTELNADKLDVNEQNGNALKFYQKFGFEIVERTEKDDQGRNYPLLRMKLTKHKLS